jgi:hypothetical protein
MMLKSTWVMATSVLFLAATLICPFPIFAQTQSGNSLKSYNQSSGTGSGDGFGYRGTTKKSQTSLGDKFGWRNPGKVKDQARSNKNTHTLAKPDRQPQSQTPGGTTIP